MLCWLGGRLGDALGGPVSGVNAWSCGLAYRCNMRGMATEQSTSSGEAAAMYPSVTYKVGNEKLVRLTEAAANRLSGLLSKQGRPGGALRVAVIGGGCSGLQYKMDLVDGPVNRDILVPSMGVRVVMDPKSALFVSGSVLDYSEELQKGGFKVTNPNAVAHCSCGESFSA
ncbi:MAG: hypothetical protein RIS92_2667 [Verrucomicrobiota bacterium]